MPLPTQIKKEPTPSPSESPSLEPTKKPSASPTSKVSIALIFFMCHQLFDSNVELNLHSKPTLKPVPPRIVPLPTASPTRNPITPVPTTCEGRKWYLLSTKEVLKLCTNGYDIPPGTVMDEGDYYDTRQACCESEFDAGTCEFMDVCVTNSPSTTPTSEPTVSPSSAPTTNSPSRNPTKVPSSSPITSSPTTCDERKWHYSPEINGCANTDDIDPSDEKAFDSVTDCCLIEFGVEDCDSYDMCAPTSSPSTGSPTSRPSTKPSGQPTTQPVIQIVTPAPSPAPTRCEDSKWHPNKDATLCINSPLPALSGDIIDGEELGIDCEIYDTYKECCEQTFGPGNECLYEDICVTDSPTISPSFSPTPEPSSSPSAKPTKSPVTSSPTPTPSKKPSTSPTRQPSKSPSSSPITSPSASPSRSPTPSVSFDSTEKKCCG